MAFNIKNLNVPSDDYVKGLQNLNGGSGGDTGGSGIATALGGAFSAFQGLTMMNSGLDLIKQGSTFQAGIYREAGKAAVQGSQFQASVFRTAAISSTVLTNYNIALDENTTRRNEDALGRQLSDITSTNYATMGASGISINSRSSMAVQNTVMTMAERQFVQIRNDTKQRQSLMQYQGELVAMQYENEARAAEYSGLVQQQASENQALSAEYQGKVDTYKTKLAQADAIGGAVGNIFKSFGGL